MKLILIASAPMAMMRRSYYGSGGYTGERLDQAALEVLRKENRMASRSLWVLALAFLVCAGTTAMVATQPTYAGLAEARTLQNAIPAQLYTISGTVRDSGGNPIADAQVIGFPDTPGQNLSINNTAVDGTYILNVIAGRYHIQASKQGFYAGHVFGVSVPPGQTGVDMSLSLLAAPATATPSGLMRVEGYLPLLKKESAAGAPDITTTPTSAAIATATPSPTPTISPTPSQTPTRTPTTTPALQPRDGHWSGTTSRNKPVSFDVSNGATSWQNFILRVSGSAGNCSSFTYEVTFDGPGPISNNQFSFQNFQSTLFITGQFTSQTAANGTYRFANYFIPGVCSGFFSQSGTWTARHQ